MNWGNLAVGAKEPQGTDVRCQVRAGVDLAGLETSSFVGPDGSAGSWFDGGEVISDDLELNYRDVDVIKRTRDGFLLGGGLQNGERICISPIEAVTNGMKVRVAPAS